MKPVDEVIYEDPTDEYNKNFEYLVYELATPTEETATPYATPQFVHAEGTEEYVCSTVADVTVPVGHDTMYSTE